MESTALAEPRLYAVTDVTYSRHKKLGKPDSVRVDYQCGLSFFSDWLPIDDERTFVRKRAFRWCWDRGITCLATVGEFLTMAEEGRVPTPTTITVKPDGKFWRVIRATFDFNKQAVGA